jgi:ATP-dependent Clp protease ATP-binding subunit ClpC
MSRPGETGTLDPVFERMTDRSRRALALAQEEARLLDHSFIGTEHILLGLIREDEGTAAKALNALGISLEPVRIRVAETIGLVGTAPTGSPPFTPRAKKVLELAFREALQLGHSYIGTEHLLLGLVREGEGVGVQVLRSLGADLHRVRHQVIQLLSGYQGNESVGADDSIPQLSDVPKCQRCHSDLDQVAVYRELTVEPSPTDQGNPPILVEVVFCSRCGTVFEMFKAGTSD